MLDSRKLVALIWLRPGAPAPLGLVALSGGAQARTRLAEVIKMFWCGNHFARCQKVITAQEHSAAALSGGAPSGRTGAYWVFPPSQWTRNGKLPMGAAPGGGVIPDLAPGDGSGGVRQ